MGFTNCLNAGELAPDAWSRSDLQQHQHGCAKALNYVGTVSGPLKRRPGFLHCALSRDQAHPGLIVPFARSVDDAFLIEFAAGNGYVWNPDGTPLMDGPSQVSFATGSSGLGFADLPGLLWKQTGDVIIFTRADGLQSHRLKRVSNTNWVFGLYGFTDGPWRAENSNHNLEITATGVLEAGETISLEASAPLFEAGHAFSRWKLRREAGTPSLPTWAPGKVYASGDAVVSADLIYVTAGGGTSGNTPPVHDFGDASDGVVTWTYHDDGAGRVTLTVITDSTHATAYVDTSFPHGFGATSYFSEQAFSPYRGYPRAQPEVREERLCFAGGPSEPDKIDLTRTAGFDADLCDFHPSTGTGLVLDDDGVRRFAGDRPGTVLWLMSTTFLVLGTTAGEAVITGPTLDDPISPAGTTVRGVSDYGSERVAPALAHDAIVYVQRGGKTLRDLAVSPDKGTATRDLSVVAEHIAGLGIAQVVWVGSDNLLWLRLSDGSLSAVVYHAEQNVYGWTRQQLGRPEDGWIVESLAVLPSGDGRDCLWALAKRTKNGSPQRVLLRQSARADGVFVDFAEIYSGSATGSVAGLDHLDGESVTAMGGATGAQAEYRDLEVDGGDVTLPNGATATRIVAGSPYLSDFNSLPLDLSGAGTTLGRKQQVKHILVTLTGVAAKVGMSNAARLESVTARDPREVLTLTSRRMVQRVSVESDTTRDPQLVVQCDGGFDLTIHALAPDETVNP